MAASNRFWCSSCGWSFSNRLSHTCPPAAAPPAHAPAPLTADVASSPLTSSEASVGPSSDEIKVVSSSCVLPDLMDILATSIPSVKRIPQQCRVAVAKSFTAIMRGCSVSGTKDQEMRAWKLQFLFPKCVLRIQPEIRGGKKKKLRRNESLRAGLLERLKRWNGGKLMYYGQKHASFMLAAQDRLRRIRWLATFGEPPSVRKMLGTAKLCLLCFLSARVPSQSRP
jgi:hypothetical protein